MVIAVGGVVYKFAHIFVVLCYTAPNYVLTNSILLCNPTPFYL